MLNKFFPNEWVDSAYGIDFRKMYDKGYRGVIFDIDNTLVKHGQDADKKAVAFMEELKDMGYSICLLSNNKRERVERFNQNINVNYIYNGKKPRRGNYLKAMQIMNTNTGNTVFVGDQLFTDVYGAKRAGLYNILVKPIDPQEEIQIVLKRYLEKIVLHFYQRN
ncbi:YqeG family HAD IIIA-type phosphatase [Anaeromicropila populeti]|uniref:YqeG family HAD IIIA-type phosphatase n=1 Tax=Anaeromicropila populeti TaxID=37658 RepID=A0A1I6KW52_9FIRM|nr:YqeG family HAD IIIA-type phosphatase [Anaeromicropila populeti]SFR95404.1 hypothetical protein SAMN05661086_02763 [Anaeromicropila populeti]